MTRIALLLARAILPLVALMFGIDWVAMPGKIEQMDTVSTQANGYRYIAKRNSAALTLASGEEVEVSCAEKRVLCQLLESRRIPWPMEVVVAKPSIVQGPWIVYAAAGGKTLIERDEQRSGYAQAKTMQAIGSVVIGLLAALLWVFPPDKHPTNAA